MLWADCALLLHEIGVAPIAHGLQYGDDGGAEIGKPVLYFGRHHWIHRADNQAVGFQFPQLLSQHFGRSLRQQLLQLVES